MIVAFFRFLFLSFLKSCIIIKVIDLFQDI